MPIIESVKNKVIFSHIPKTGGTTIEKYFENHPQCKLFFKNPTGSKKSGLPCSPQHFHGKMLSYCFGDELKSFALVRSPFDRIISEFKWANKIIKKNSIPEGLDFDDWVISKLDEAKNKPFMNDNHLRPQDEFLLKDTIWYKLESNGIESIIRDICQALEVDYMFFEDFKTNQTASISIDMSSETKNYINDYYDVDFNSFDYDRRF